MRVVIIGAGEQTANMVDLFDIDYRFIFDDPREPGEKKYGLRVVDHIPPLETNILWISSVGKTRHKRELIERAMKLTDGPVLEDFTNLTHPMTTVAKTAEKDLGIYMQPYSAIYARAKVGNHALLCGACNVGHHSVIGDYCTLGHQAFLGGHVTLQDGVFLGAGVTIKEAITIGEGAVIGMGAVVTKDVPPNEVWIGNPARPMKDKDWPYGHKGMFLESSRPKKMMEAWT